jgi:hypothetical protein
MTKLIKSTFELVGAALGAGFQNYLRNVKNIDLVLSIIIASLLAAFITFILEFLILQFLLQTRIVRSFNNSLSNLEGYWLLNVEDENRPICFAQIFFDRKTGEYIYKGRGFDKKGKYVAEWYSKTLQYVDEMEGFFYMGNGLAYKEGVKNWGSISFDKDIEGKQYVMGTGTFIDIGIKDMKFNFNMKRITKKSVVEKIKGDGLKCNEDIENYVKECIKDMHFEY